MMKSLLAALLMLAAPIANAQVTFYNAEFIDPYSQTPDDVLLGISVDTNCPDSLTITVNVPAPSVSNPIAYFSANADLGLTSLAGNYNGNSAGADITISYSGQASTWTFSNFKYIVPQSTPSPGFTNNGYRIVVDIVDTTILGVSPGFAINPANGAVQVTQLFGPPSTLFSAIQTDSVCKGPGGLSGDPQFAGFQGQTFQFHGMADEVFSLISTPTFQMNGNFRYISSGKCDYNDTACFTHPGTYVDELGFSIGDVKVKAIAGSHANGLRLWMNDVEVRHAPTAINNKIIFAIFNSTEETGSLSYRQSEKFIIDVPQFTVEVTNSDYFFNMEVSLKDASILRAGAKKTNLHKKFLCSSSGHKSVDRLGEVEAEMAQHYPRFPIHGLIGQTWRNSIICDHAWVGDASDYVTSDIFAHDSTFNYYLSQ